MLDDAIWFKRSSQVRPLFVVRRGVNGPKLEHVLCLTYDDSFLMNDAPANRCIEAITGGRAGIRWGGNVYALRVGRTVDFLESADMEEDLEPLVTFFKEHGVVETLEPFAY
ncbi:hypothetical protein M413DRAFT_29896 [Hebeloma cylindrosporum]|uniref:Uncharacterized protein n=1 Tax=Hebeloma cylindrosporum TaxID=76867 RepID=A0A0C3C4Z3_HEBCY|nr:hypothetical protein M413DRAFT_29896 [Hebeloma cylindrosporum h7]